jgi:hypothetical protein
VKAKSEPAYFLREVSAVDVLPDGRASLTYDGDSQRHFGPEQWKALERAGGDLSVLGFTVKREQPVPNLAAHWRGG